MRICKASSLRDTLSALRDFRMKGKKVSRWL